MTLSAITPTPRRPRRIVALAASALLLAASSAGVGAAAASAAPGDASIRVVHGIPGVPVDVLLDGTVVLPNFQPATVAGPLPVPPGTHQVTINQAGTNTQVLSQPVTVTANLSATLVANLSAAGTPELSVFADDVSSIPKGQARLVVRHTAAAPPVDVRANGQVAFANLVHGAQASAVLPAGTITADVVLTGTQTVVIGPATLNLAAGTSTIVYAIGSATATPSSLALVVQTITGLAAADPGAAVNTGGSVVSDDTAPLPWIIGGAGVLGVLLAAGAVLVHRRQRQGA